MVRHGPCAVTATAVSLVKLTTCKLLNISQANVLAFPAFIATPNRASFQIIHPSLSNILRDRSIVDIRKEIDKEVNRMIRAKLDIKQYSNLRLNELLNNFGPSVIDRFYDINEFAFADWLFTNFEDITGESIWNNAYEKQGTVRMRQRYLTVDGIEVDLKQSVKQFLSEVNGNEMDLLPEKMRKFYMKRRNWMRFNNIQNFNEKMKDHEQKLNNISDDENSEIQSKYEREMDLVMNKQWTHRFGLFDFQTSTIYNQSTIDELKFSAYEMQDLGCGLPLPNDPSRSWNSMNIQTPITYLNNTNELGKIVIYEIRLKGHRNGNKMIFKIDVFPGYNSDVMGPNPYIMFRDTFQVKHLASVIPTDHQLHIPQLTEIIDWQSDGNVQRVLQDSSAEL